jgi:hypothetical protein
MKKMLLLLLVPLFLLACTFSLPATWLNETTNPPGPTRTPLGLGLAEVRLHPNGGELLTQLEAQAPKASALGQHMFVEFDASW